MTETFSAILFALLVVDIWNSYAWLASTSKRILFSLVKSATVGLLLVVVFGQVLWQLVFIAVVALLIGLAEAHKTTRRVVNPAARLAIQLGVITGISGLYPDL